MDTDKLTQRSFLPSTAAPRAEAVTRAVTDPPPADYVEIRLTGSGGRMSAPALLHFRDYTFPEAVELSEATEENVDQVVVRVLTAMCWEKFDCSLLHREEAKEILLNIYARWWGKVFDQYYYQIDEAKPLSQENRSVASIPIQNIQIRELPREFEEPIVCEGPDGRRIGFVLPRLINTIAARAWIKERYAEEDAGFSDVRVALRSGSDAVKVSFEQMTAYEAHEHKKRMEEIDALCALQLYSVDGAELPDFDAKMEALRSLPAGFFGEWAHERRTRFSFGIEPVVTFDCSVTHKPISRRFPFRLVDLVPAVGTGRHPGFTFSYGGKVPVDGGDDARVSGASNPGAGRPHPEKGADGSDAGLA